MSLLGQKNMIAVSNGGRSETASRYQGAGLEHHSIAGTRGGLLLVYVTFRNWVYHSSERRPPRVDSTPEGFGGDD